jgi:hypothetical protein
MRLASLQQFGMQVIAVAGRDLQGVTITAAPTATLAGRVTFEGGAAQAGENVAIHVIPDPDQGPIVRSGPEGGASAEGTFQLRGLAGLLRLLPVPPPGRWVKSIHVGGIDATDAPVRVGAGDSPADVSIVIASGAASLAGQVDDGVGRAVDDYRVIVFSTDAQRWYGRSPYVRIGFGPEADGGFTVRDLPPGDYWAVAVAGIEGDASVGEWQNPEVLASLVSAARGGGRPGRGRAAPPGPGGRK